MNEPDIIYLGKESWRKGRVNLSNKDISPSVTLK